MQRAVDILDQASRGVGLTIRWLALAMVLIQFAIVVARYVFGLSNVAVQESVLYLHGALFMLGAGYTLMVDGHVRVDILYARLGPLGRRRLDLFGHVALLMPTMVAILYWSWPSVINAWSILEGPISVGGIKAVFLLKSLIPAFAVLLLLQSLVEVLRLLAGARPEGQADG